MIQKLQKVLALVPFLIAATLGGLVSGMLVKGCSPKESVQVHLNLDSYETKLQKISRSQDSINAVLPGLDDALRELSGRYDQHQSPKSGKSPATGR